MTQPPWRSSSHSVSSDMSLSCTNNNNNEHIIRHKYTELVPQIENWDPESQFNRSFTASDAHFTSSLSTTFAASRSFSEIKEQDTKSRTSDLLDTLGFTSTMTSKTDKIETLLGSSCDESSEDDDIYEKRPIQSQALVHDESKSQTFETKTTRPPTIGEDNAWLNRSPSIQKSANDNSARIHYLSPSGSSINCSTTASLSARSTTSSTSKAFKSYCLDDCCTSSKSSVCGSSSTKRFDNKTQERPKLLGLKNGNESFADQDDDDVAQTPLKTARESLVGRDARRSSMGLSEAKPPTVPSKFVEVANERLGRLLRLTQKSVVGRLGVITTQTRIEVFDTTTAPTISTLFAVRHSDPSLWGRQLKVHRNIFLACKLAGVEVPKEIDMPIDARNGFDQTDNVQHMHAYLERIVPHIKLKHTCEDVQLIWWRAIGNGVAVLQNQRSGKLLLLKNVEKTISSAIDCLCKIINSSKLESPQFSEADPNYPTKGMILEETQSKVVLCPIASASNSSLNSCNLYSFTYLKLFSDSYDEEVDIDGIDTLITRIWGEEDFVSPLSTKFVIKLQTSRYLRYSVGTDSQDPTTLLLQVHFNEPLSRGMNVYHVCTAPFTIKSNKYGDIRLSYCQAVWFLRKLYEVHSESHSRSTPCNQSTSNITNPTTSTLSDQAPPAMNRLSERRRFDAKRYDTSHIDNVDSDPKNEPPRPEHLLESERPESAQKGKINACDTPRATPKARQLLKGTPPRQTSKSRNQRNFTSPKPNDFRVTSSHFTAKKAFNLATSRGDLHGSHQAQITPNPSRREPKANGMALRSNTTMPRLFPQSASIMRGNAESTPPARAHTSWSRPPATFAATTISSDGKDGNCSRLNASPERQYVDKARRNFESLTRSTKKTSSGESTAFRVNGGTHRFVQNGGATSNGKFSSPGRGSSGSSTKAKIAIYSRNSRTEKPNLITPRIGVHIRDRTTNCPNLSDCGFAQPLKSRHNARQVSVVTGINQESEGSEPSSV